MFVVFANYAIYRKDNYKNIIVEILRTFVESANYYCHILIV